MCQTKLEVLEIANSLLSTSNLQFTPMNNFTTIDIDYVRGSRTIETTMVTSKNLSKVYFIYNYEGISFRVFENHLSLINFFQGNAESDFHFSTETELDNFLETVQIFG